MIFQPQTISKAKGFSLLELLIVIAIMAGLAAAGAGFYRSFMKEVEVDSAAKVLAGDLRSVRSKAMTGEGGSKWGLHAVNVNGGDQYYELFSTQTNYAGGVVVATTTLPLGVRFSDPGTGANKDIIFSKIYGTTTATSLVLISESTTKTISITSIGAIN